MKRMGRACLSAICVVCLLLQCFGISAAAGQDDISVSSGCHSIDAAKALNMNTQVVETAKAVVVYERISGTMIYSWNADSRVFPASMVKLMTALVALENGDLSSKVVISQSALAQVPAGALSIGLKAGEELTLEQLLYCMMVASSNDAAVVIAQYIGGSQERFIAKMNEKARELGCTDTNFSNVHGLHSEQTYTTARDVCRILLAGLENPRFQEMFCAQTYVIPETNQSEERKLKTTNTMMLTSASEHYDKRVTGGRTGSTNAAGRCIAITAEANGMELVCVLMGAEPTYTEDGKSVLRFGSFEEMAELLDYAFDGHELHPMATGGQIMTQLEVVNGANHVAVRPDSSIITVLPKGVDPQTLRWEFESSTLTAPVEAGQSAGTMQVWYEGICVGQTQLITANSVPVESTLVMAQRPSEMEGQGGWKILLIILGVLAAVGAVVAAVSILPRTIRKIKNRMIVRRRRRNRRRTR